MMAGRMTTQTEIRERCVVILGRSGAGKSTIANVLIGCDPISQKSPRFAVSHKALDSLSDEVVAAKTEFLREDIKYQVTVIDTVGLFDARSAGSRQSNETICEKLEEYFKDHITSVNLILFVCKKGRFTPAEMDTFLFIRRRFVKEICPISALVFTGCEADPPEVRKEFREDFNSHIHTKEIALQMKKGVHTVGFPALSRMLPELQPTCKKQMEEDKEHLIKLIVNCDDKHLTKELFREKVKPQLSICNIL